MAAGGACGGRFGSGRTGGATVSGNNGACCVAQGEDCTTCGVGCGDGGQGWLACIGIGRGDYIQETTYRYVGCVGDFDVVRPRRDCSTSSITESYRGGIEISRNLDPWPFRTKK